MSKNRTYFKCIESFVRVHLAPACPEAVRRQFLDLWQNIAIKAHIHISMILVQIILKFGIAQFITRFKFAVVLSLLLNCIICQVHHPIGEVRQGEFSATRSHVALLVIVSLVVSILGSGHAECANVKLATMY